MFYVRALLLILLCLPSLTHAQGANLAFGGIKQDPTLPLELSADELDINQENGTAVFTGNVLVGQGEMRLAAPHVLVVYAADNKRISRLEATGGVTLVSGPDAAEAETADYNVDTGTVVMRGNVLLTQGQNAMTSQEMTVDLKTGTARMDGRVKTVLQPKE